LLPFPSAPRESRPSLSVDLSSAVTFLVSRFITRIGDPPHSSVLRVLLGHRRFDSSSRRFWTSFPPDIMIDSHGVLSPVRVAFPPACNNIQPCSAEEFFPLSFPLFSQIVEVSQIPGTGGRFLFFLRSFFASFFEVSNPL